jgi:hypothetical protein
VSAIELILLAEAVWAQKQQKYFCFLLTQGQKYGNFTG